MIRPWMDIGFICEGCGYHYDDINCIFKCEICKWEICAYCAKGTFGHLCYNCAQDEGGDIDANKI